MNEPRNDARAELRLVFQDGGDYHILILAWDIPRASLIMCAVWSLIF